MRLFNASVHEDGLGEASWELLASVQPAQREALEAELADVLAQAAQAALACDVEWQHELQRVDEAGGWHTVHLTLCGPSFWGEKALAEWLQEPSASSG